MGLDDFYRDSRLHIMELAAGLPNEASDTPVPACPGWSVHDMVGHLVGIIEDAFAGTLTVPPPPSETAVQVERWQSRSLAEAFEQWDRLGPEFENVVEATDTWLAAADIAQHEHDVRGALGLPDRRDCAAMRAITDRMLQEFHPPTPLSIELEDTRVQIGDWQPGGLVLRTTRWEAFRWRAGRRSRAQLAAMDWSGEPGDVLDHLGFFGPSPLDIIE